MQPPRPAPAANRRTSRLPRGARRIQLLRAAQLDLKQIEVLRPRTDPLAFAESIHADVFA